MSDQWQAIAKWGAPIPGSRRLRAYGLNADGSRIRLDCEAIYVALDDERGLVISLSERRATEGLAIRSMPQREAPRGDVEEKPMRFSSLAVRAGGANLIYVTSEDRGDDPI